MKYCRKYRKNEIWFFFIQDMIIFLEWTSYIILIFIVTKVDNWSMTYFSDGQIGSWRVYDVLVMDESVKKKVITEVVKHLSCAQLKY